jgi:CDP-diacylglycerol--glycerol-3-phosphate 3-phosphatidyltransferase
MSEQKVDRITASIYEGFFLLNLPNILAFTRILLAPLLFWVILNEQVFVELGFHVTWAYYFAAVIFIVASATDFFDGYIAREWKQETKLGAIIDPLADKMITIAAFLGLMVSGEASAWAIYIIIVRELFITGIRTVAVAEGLDIKASFAGKVKTVSQMIAIGFLLMHWPFGSALLWIAVALTLYSGLEYLWGFRKAILKDDK